MHSMSYRYEWWMDWLNPADLIDIFFQNGETWHASFISFRFQCSFSFDFIGLLIDSFHLFFLPSFIYFSSRPSLTGAFVRTFICEYVFLLHFFLSFFFLIFFLFFHFHACFHSFFSLHSVFL